MNKLLDENKGVSFCDLGLGKSFLRHETKSTSDKRKNRQTGLHTS